MIVCNDGRRNLSMSRVTPSRGATNDALARHYWRGQGPLWKIYWVYGAFGSLLLAIAIVCAIATDFVGSGTKPVALAIGGAYTAWVLVSIWRCAFNVAGAPLGMDRNGWALLVRMLTIAWAINVAAGLVFVSTMIG
jgi:hypothetical protein